MPHRLLPDIPTAAWPLPALLVNQHGIAQRCQAIGDSIAAVMSLDEVRQLPSGQGYSELGIALQSTPENHQ